jgi:hypothetical protein
MTFYKHLQYDTKSDPPNFAPNMFYKGFAIDLYCDIIAKHGRKKTLHMEYYPSTFCDCKGSMPI